mgnify:CR=1 FL=1
MTLESATTGENETLVLGSDGDILEVKGISVSICGGFWEQVSGVDF